MNQEIIKIEANNYDILQDDNESINTTLTADELDMDLEAFDELEDFFLDENPEEFAELLKLTEDENIDLDNFLIEKPEQHQINLIKDEEFKLGKDPYIIQGPQVFQFTAQSIKSENESFDCFICNRSYTVMNSLKRHFTSMKHRRMEAKLNGTTVEVFEPEIPSPAQSNLVLVQTGDFCFEIGFDQAQTTRKIPNLKDKTRRYVPNDNGIFECEDCGKKFTTSSNLRRHEHLHGSQKLHECKICGKKFMQKEYLKKHMITHRPRGVAQYLF